MARVRLIKPGFFTNDALGALQPAARLLFAGLWLLADREGRLEDRPKRIKAQILPYDRIDVDKLLTVLHEAGFVVRYEAAGDSYIQITNFTKHQQPHYKEVASIIPPPSGHADSGTTPGGVSEAVRQRVFDRDGRACVECGKTEALSLDHIVPRSKGGSHDESNLRTLCKSCNSVKRSRDLNSMSVQGRANVGLSSPSDPDPHPDADPDPNADPDPDDSSSEPDGLMDSPEDRQRFFRLVSQR